MGAIKGSEGRILFVEDEPDISEAMTRQLQRAGFEVTTARTVKELSLIHI